MALTALPEAMPQDRPPRETGATVLAAIVVIALAVALIAYTFDGWSSGPPSATGPLDSETALSRALGDIPNVSINYYDIESTDAHGIRNELSAKAPHLNGERFRSVTHWHLKWRWEAAPDGGCGTAYAQVIFNAEIMFPRLARPNALTPQVAESWRSYINALARHEANHVRYAYDHRDKVLNAVRSASCAEANAAGHREIAELKQTQAAYDEQTNHGAREGATFRPKSNGFLSAF